MRKAFVACAAIIGLCSSSIVSAATPANVIGRILLQTEQNGEAWYVDPVTTERVYIRNGDGAFSALRTFGLGITNSDIVGIQVGVNSQSTGTDTDGDGLSDDMEFALGSSSTKTDSDGDSYSDLVEVTNGFDPNGTSDIDAGVSKSLASRLSGRILLQVESRGEAWYVNPADGKRYYMNNGDAAYDLMRSKSLGITDADLSTIPTYTGVIDCGGSLDCIIGAVQSHVQVKGTQELVFLSIVTKGSYTFSYADGMTMFDTTILSQTADGVETGAAGMVTNCTYPDSETDTMVAAMERWQAGSSSTDDLAFASCRLHQ